MSFILRTAIYVLVAIAGSNVSIATARGAETDASLVAQLLDSLYQANTEGSAELFESFPTSSKILIELFSCTPFGAKDSSTKPGLLERNGYHITASLFTSKVPSAEIAKKAFEIVRVLPVDCAYTETFTTLVLGWIGVDPAPIARLLDPLTQSERIEFWTAIVRQHLCDDYGTCGLFRNLDTMLVESPEHYGDFKKVFLNLASLHWIEDYIFDGYRVLDYATGNLNGDGFSNDVALVLARINEADGWAGGTWPGTPRPLLLLFEEANHSYRLAIRNDSIVGTSLGGGVLGDPFEEVAIQVQGFTVYHQGGSRETWRRDRCFTWASEREVFVLDTINETWIDRADPSGNFHCMIWDRSNFLDYTLDTLSLDDEIKITVVHTSSEIPPRAATPVDSIWVTTLLDTTLSNVDPFSVQETMRMWKEQGVPEQQWSDYFLATEIPLELEEGTMYIVQPSWEPNASMFHGAHASFFWIVQDSTRYDEEGEYRVISRILLSGMADFVSVDLASGDGYPPITLALGYANRLEASFLRYDRESKEYKIADAKTTWFTKE